MRSPTLSHRGGGGGVAPVVVVGHGSRDPRSARTVRALAHAVARTRGGSVTAAFLDLDAPSVGDALRTVATRVGPPPVLVPLLLTSAHHDRVDLPRAVAESGVPARVTPVLGPPEPGHLPDPLLLAALLRRLGLSGRDRQHPVRADGAVLMAAGTTHEAARSTVESVAASLATRLDVACIAGYASASGPTVAEAVAELRARGARCIVAASYFLAPGRLYEAAAASARAAGVVGIAEPIGAAGELVELVVRRVRSAAAHRTHHPSDHEMSATRTRR